MTASSSALSLSLLGDSGTDGSRPRAASRGGAASWSSVDPLLFPTIYTCLRLGDVGAAASVAHDAPRSAGSAVLAALDTLAASPNEPLPSSQRHSLSAELKSLRLAGTASTGYRGAVLSYLAGEFDASTVATSAQDFLWIRLRTCWIDGAAGVRERLASVRSVLTAAGPRHFDPEGNAPLLYTQLLLLTAAPAAAVDFLATAGAAWRSDAVHLALAAMEAGALDLPPTSTGCSLVSLLRTFLAPLATEAPLTACLYALQLPDFRADEPPGQERASMLGSIALRSGEFEVLLGTLDGGRGALAALAPPSDIAAAALFAGDSLAAAGRRCEAAALYDLCGRRELTLKLLVEELGARAATRTEDQDRVVRLAWSFYSHRLDDEIVSNPTLITSLELLLRMVEILDLRAAGAHADVLDRADQLDFIPRTTEAVGAAVSTVRSLSFDVRRNVNAVLLAVMESTAEAARAAGAGEASAALRERAKAIVMLSGLLPDLPGKVHGRLVRLEVMTMF